MIARNKEEFSYQIRKNGINTCVLGYGRRISVDVLEFHILKDKTNNLYCYELITGLAVPYNKPDGFNKLRMNDKLKHIELELKRQFERILNAVIVYHNSDDCKMIINNHILNKLDEIEKKYTLKGGD